jgi:hypothetical protein
LIFFPPLGGHEAVREQGGARIDKATVGRGGVERVGWGEGGDGGLGVEPDKIDRAERAVGVDLAHDTPDPGPVVGLGGFAVKSKGEEAAVGRNIKSHALVGNRLGAVG